MEITNLFHFLEQSRFRVNNISVNIDVCRHERMMLYHVHRVSHGVFRVVESLEPVVEVDAASCHGVDNVLPDASLHHSPFHFLAVHVAGTAVGVCHNHNLLNVQLVYSHENASHCRVKRTDNQSAGILYQFCVAIFDAQCGRQQLRQSCVHTREDGKFLVGVFAREEFLVAFVLNKFFVVSDNFFYNHNKKFILSFRRKPGAPHGS